MTLKEEIKLLEKKVKLLKEVAELEEKEEAKPIPIDPWWCNPHIYQYPYLYPWARGIKVFPYVPYTPPYSTGGPLPPDPIITVTNDGDLLPSESITITNDFKTISAN